ncbi:hypothetical protein ALP26_103427 [Pseudomonas savastanoi pv. glycinea]|uniref:Uncharacterized protein n=1 Tax=Pseudomonas savastanoi pv. glycinea TaxID=318 RepID=A0A3M3W131_PSESG|nr:hypothetical protein ALQ97_102940 [Pseudomonas savastanoi pv. glycinea]RML85172.1 hypothetical protein ALQ87_102681 [Pseudomonas savastanoi pv. glycinea]RMN25109.1 hypothetical protein ALQ66_103252 [Pseudomonas savastanoi pv. glycinea]RMO51611.1 hypothetical protein ALQ41_102782 [Pseudomonas savastanoi pv. glycinea]RMU57638.1 hypothetical protein ALP26_103427 [Pseudomonas savastanoi pv. glycinea]
MGFPDSASEIRTQKALAVREAVNHLHGPITAGDDHSIKYALFSCLRLDDDFFSFSGNATYPAKTNAVP